MLTIKHLTGPLADTETPIDRAVNRVVFGRQMQCDVVFPPEETLVSGRHFALVKKDAGQWTIDLFGDPFVAVNGKPAEQGQVVRTGSKLELGRQGGPSFEAVIVPDTRLHNYRVTEKQQAFENARTLAVRARGTARIASVGVVIVAVVAAIFGVSQYFSGKTTAAKLDDAVSQLATVQKENAETTIGAPVREKLTRSVYRVFSENVKTGGLDGIGTAWPVGPHLLATNAHVAEDRAKLKPGTVMKVRSPGADGKAYLVTRVRIHPAFVEWHKFIGKDPILLADPAGQENYVATASGYDVALLEVDETLPTEHIFALASPGQYKTLRAGQPLATAGYPSEGIRSDVAGLIRATPTFHLGSVTGLTNFFYLPADDENRQLIHDDLPTAGGASGSPVVDGTGRVVGLQNSGTMSHFKVKGLPSRIPSAAMVNFAQRVDMLQELIDGRQDATLPTYRSYWDKQVAFFRRGIDVFIPEVIGKAKAKSDDLVTTVLDKTLKLTSAERHGKRTGGYQRQSVTPLTLTNGSTYLFVAYGYELAQLELYLMIDKRMADYTKGSWYPSIKYRTDASGGDKNIEAWFPVLKAPEQATTNVDLWVVGPEDKDISYTLRIYKIDPRVAGG